jgi:hypothetical protein
MGRANERGFSFSRTFPGFASVWVDFVDQNKSLEQAIQRSPCSRLYSEWRAIQDKITNSYVLEIEI